jgi:hypothetical protein
MRPYPVAEVICHEFHGRGRRIRPPPGRIRGLVAEVRVEQGSDRRDAAQSVGDHVVHDHKNANPSARQARDHVHPP